MRCRVRSAFRPALNSGRSRFSDLRSQYSVCVCPSPPGSAFLPSFLSGPCYTHAHQAFQSQSRLPLCYANMFYLARCRRTLSLGRHVIDIWYAQRSKISPDLSLLGGGNMSQVVHRPSLIMGAPFGAVSRVSGCMSGQ